MARKAASDPAEGQGRNDILGVIFFALSVIVLIALFTYDRNDLGINSIPGNKDVQNWIGVIGAHSAWRLFFVFGAAAYLLPIVLLFLSLGYLLSFLTYLQRRWLWSTVLIFSCMGLLDLYGSNLTELRQNLNAPSAGGIIGQVMNDVVFRHFGKVGATLVFLTVYTVSLLYLTNFRLGQWLRQTWEEQMARRAAANEQFREKNIQAEEKALAKRAKELDKEAKKLQQQVEKEVDVQIPSASTLGADLQPVPEPTVRDLSVPQSKTVKPNKGKGNPFESGSEAILGPDAEIISAKEIAAASQDDVLGKAGPAPGNSAGKETADRSTEESPAEAAALNAASGGPKPRVLNRKNKPITVASTPIIGNYQVPQMTLLNYPDQNV
ncbi:MAG TPA: DNA translocase FtsK 4TM domain-containing protein, partial [Verrucomicrobiae bacterium]|nr:DNA translocase FtsK 4TM domain-containing protein [Verrucomicrobiae bacterium]